MAINNENINRISHSLPKHLKCAAHTISLCLRTDVSNFIKRFKEFQELHKKVIEKCNLLWKLAKRPTEIIESVLDCSLHQSGATRWNSLYDSLKQILQHKEKVVFLCRSLGVTIFLPTDFTLKNTLCVHAPSQKLWTFSKVKRILFTEFYCLVC